MAATNINRVIMTGNLTRDPELRSLPSGTAVCSLRIACNTRRKDASAIGRQGELLRCDRVGQAGRELRQYLSKGRPVAVDGRLEWREWEAQDGRQAQAVEIVADSVQFLGGRDDAGSGNGFSARQRRPGRQKDFAPSPASGGGAGDDDIPF